MRRGVMHTISLICESFKPASGRPIAAAAADITSSLSMTALQAKTRPVMQGRLRPEAKSRRYPDLAALDRQPVLLTAELRPRRKYIYIQGSSFRTTDID